MSTWSGGLQGEVTVTAGSEAISGWTVHPARSSGRTISQVWNANLTTSDSDASVRNTTYNGSLPASGSTTFGFITTGTPGSPDFTCTTS